jgi:hypothetical protein
MKLSILLSKITPLPWAAGMSAKSPEQRVLNQAYTIHASNVLPELITSAKKVALLSDRDCVEWHELKAALARAEEVAGL